MFGKSPNREAWVASAIRELRRSGSWTGRIHVHKLLYLVSELGLAKPPFSFVLYQYGPYSYDLDAAIADMEMFGQIEKSFPKPGYGPRYGVSDFGSASGPCLALADADAVVRVARAFGNLDSQSLEVLATCVWVELKEGLKSDDAIVNRVKFLKPKYDESRIRLELRAARDLIRNLREGDSVG